MKVLVIARVAHEINRAYCASLGDNSQPAWEDAPDWQRESAIAGVEMHLANPDATPEQSHESWLAQKLAAGWTYGEVKDAEKKQHPCCVPYDELPTEQKAKDHLFRAVVHMLKSIPDEMIAQPTAAAQIAEIRPSQVAVRYIGRRPEWHDRVYSTGLQFTTGQVRVLPAEIARRFLRHADLFEKVEQEVSEAEAAPVAADPEQLDDDTADLLEQGKAAQEQQKAQQSLVQELYDQIDQMDKKGLEEFASTKYRHDLDKRRSVGDLRTQVKQLIDQFGVV